MRNEYEKGLYLEYFTVGYNFIEAGVAILLGILASSIALVGFGMDSIIETLSGFILIWRLRQQETISKEHEEKLEQRAMKFVALTFFVLGGYVIVQSVRKLIASIPPEPSLPGIILAGISLIIMPFLAYGKIKVGKEIDSGALLADAKETLACAFLSLSLFLGLAGNYFFGLWQADPIAATIIAIFLFKEGWETWQEAGE